MRLACLFALSLSVLLPASALAEDISSKRDYMDPAQRDRPIACKPGDMERFPGKTLGEVFGDDWPAQPPPSSPASQAGPEVVQLAPMHPPRGLDPQNSFTVVAVLISPEGKPLRAEILCSTRMGMDAAVRRQALASTYQPAQVDGQPVTSVGVRVAAFRVAPRMRAPRSHTR